MAKAEEPMATPSRPAAERFSHVWEFLVMVSCILGSGLFGCLFPFSGSKPVATSFEGKNATESGRGKIRNDSGVQLR
jgi:hypothetical protein